MAESIQDVTQAIAEMIYQDLQKKYQKGDQLDPRLLLTDANLVLSGLELTTVKAPSVLFELQKSALLKRDPHGHYIMQ